MLRRLLTPARHRSIWPLGTAGREVWVGQQCAPPFDVTQQLTLGLVGGPQIKRSVERGIVFRNYEHVLDWSHRYCAVEAKILLEKFCTIPKKTFEMAAMISDDKIDARVVVRLKTEGVDGYTAYDITWRKLDSTSRLWEDEDTYQCCE